MSAGQNGDLMEATMLHEHVINFLQAAVLLLMLINAVSIATAAYALSFFRTAYRPDQRSDHGPRLARAVVALAAVEQALAMTEASK
jgi:hypothetical protein